MKGLTNKTLEFKQKEDTDKISKYFNLNSNKTNSSNIIRYPKYRNKKKNGIKYIKNNKPLLIVIVLAIIFSFISFFNNKLMSSNSTESNSSIVSSSTESTLTRSELKNYSEIISTDIKKTLKISSTTEVDAKTMHKNGNSIYTRGTISIPNEEAVYFDAILKNKQMSSLVINGIEYIK